MFCNEYVKKAMNLLTKVDGIYISDKFFEMMNEQSCDCDEIVIKSGDNYILLSSMPLGEDGYIEVKALDGFDASRFPYEVDISGEYFEFDKLCLHENGLTDGIRFKGGGAFLFVLALEHNLALTMSKYDLFEEMGTVIQEPEAELKIKRRIYINWSEKWMNIST